MEKSSGIESGDLTVPTNGDVCYSYFYTNPPFYFPLTITFVCIPT